MHPKTEVALTELDTSLRAAARLHRRLTRLRTHRPPLYWELSPDTLRIAQQLVWNLQQEKKQLLAAQQEDHPFLKKQL